MFRFMFWMLVLFIVLKVLGAYIWPLILVLIFGACIVANIGPKNPEA